MLRCFFSAALVIVVGTLTSLAETDLQVRVVVGDTAPDGGSWDGKRLYLLPFEATTTSPPDLAVCVHTDGGETVCNPQSLEHGTSPCPDKKICILSLTLQRPFEHFVVSVFDIDPLGKKTLDGAQKLIGDVLRGLERDTGNDLSSDEIQRQIRETNLRRWQWVESVAFDKAEEIDPFNANNDPVEDIARLHAERVAPPQIFSAFRDGRVSSPFEVKPIWDCLYPAPECYYEYVQITLNSKKLTQEGN